MKLIKITIQNYDEPVVDVDDQPESFLVQTNLENHEIESEISKIEESIKENPDFIDIIDEEIEEHIGGIISTVDEFIIDTDI